MASLPEGYQEVSYKGVPPSMISSLPIIDSMLIRLQGPEAGRVGPNDRGITLCPFLHEPSNEGIAHSIYAQTKPSLIAASMSFMADILW